MIVSNASAMCRGVHPRCDVGPENPYPGSEGITNENASAGSPGSVNGAMVSTNSTIEPGHPCARSSGIAPACGDGTCRKWMRCPATSVRKLS